MKNFILVHLESLSSLIFNENRQLFPKLEDICYGGMCRELCTQLENDAVFDKNEQLLFDVLGSKGYRTKGII